MIICYNFIKLNIFQLFFCNENQTKKVLIYINTFFSLIFYKNFLFDQFYLKYSKVFLFMIFLYVSLFYSKGIFYENIVFFNFRFNNNFSLTYYFKIINQQQCMIILILSFIIVLLIKDLFKINYF